jgi:hypothetical protein
VISVLVSTCAFPTLSSHAKTKSINPYNEKRVLQQNKNIQKQNNAPDDFPNFIREGNNHCFFIHDHCSITCLSCDASCKCHSYVFY